MVFNDIVLWLEVDQHDEQSVQNVSREWNSF